MTYNEWRDELKSNLLSVGEAERKRVLDYYAEAYADRREAGFEERAIIEEFGAPYDAARRILNDNENQEKQAIYDDKPNETPPPVAPPAPKAKTSVGKTVGLILLCICALPIIAPLLAGCFTLAAMLFCVPFACVVCGLGTLVGSFAACADGSYSYGTYMLGEAFILLGAGLLMLPSWLKFIRFAYKKIKRLFLGIVAWFKARSCTV